MAIPIPKAPIPPVIPGQISSSDLMWVDLEDFLNGENNFSGSYYFDTSNTDRSLADILKCVPKEIGPENIFIRIEESADSYLPNSSSEEEDYQEPEKPTFKIYFKPNATLTDAQIKAINKKNEADFLKKQEAYRDAFARYENVDMVEYKIKLKEAEILELKKKMMGFVK